jgi:hypothetical protein
MARLNLYNSPSRERTILITYIIVRKDELFSNFQPRRMLHILLQSFLGWKSLIKCMCHTFWCPSYHSTCKEFCHAEDPSSAATRFSFLFWFKACVSLPSVVSVPGFKNKNGEFQG